MASDVPRNAGSGRFRRGEIPLVLASGGYFFSLLCGYSILRPLRDTAGIAGDSPVLEWLFLGTFLAMLVAVPVHGALVARLRRSRFIAGSTVFFALHLLAFVVALDRWPGHEIIIGRVFFVWVSVFNLFVVSIFWSLMADRWTHAEGLRVFGVIASFGSLGAIVGSQLTAQLAERWSIGDLLLLSTALLLATVLFLAVIERIRTEEGIPEDAPVGGSILAGLVAIAGSPLLRRATTMMFLMTVCASIAYFVRSEVIGAAEVSDEARRRVFAWTDTATQSLTFLLQLVGFRLLVGRAGIGPTLGILPAVYALGFLLLVLVPGFGVMVAFEAFRRATAYGVAGPTRNLVFTVVDDEQKYKTKAFIDTVVYRGGDVVGAHLYATLASFVALPAVVGVGAVYAVLAGVTALALGREVRARLAHR